MNLLSGGFIGIEEIDGENDFSYDWVLSRIVGASRTGGGASSLPGSVLVLMLREESEREMAEAVFFFLREEGIGEGGVKGFFFFWKKDRRGKGKTIICWE